MLASDRRRPLTATARGIRYRRQRWARNSTAAPTEAALKAVKAPEVNVGTPIERQTVAIARARRWGDTIANRAAALKAIEEISASGIVSARGIARELTAKKGPDHHQQRDLGRYSRPDLRIVPGLGGDPPGPPPRPALSCCRLF
jgi:hypothetical protein